MFLAIIALESGLDSYKAERAAIISGKSTVIISGIHSLFQFSLLRVTAAQGSNLPVLLFLSLVFGNIGNFRICELLNEPVQPWR